MDGGWYQMDDTDLVSEAYWLEIYILTNRI
jgi:hypothetical protein